MHGATLPDGIRYRRLTEGASMAKRPYLGIAILLLLCAAALTYQARHLGLTIDEPSHFAAAYMYWLGEDVLQPSDTPPLTRAISAGSLGSCVPPVP